MPIARTDRVRPERVHDWLCSVSPDWKAKVNPCSGKEVTWPVGLGGKGNAGVSSTISTNPGAIGYIELAYAIQNKVTFGNVKNASGKFITPSLDSVAAAAKFDTIPPDLTFDVYGLEPAGRVPDRDGHLDAGLPAARQGERRTRLDRKPSFTSCFGPSTRAATTPRRSTTPCCRTP